MTAICTSCKTKSIIKVVAKCDDRCSLSMNSISRHDYVPANLGIGGGDYITFSYCHICMKIQSSAYRDAIQEVFAPKDTGEDDEG